MKAEIDMSEWDEIILTNCLLIVAFYISSIGLVFYQQWYLKQFAFPLFVTAFNQLVKFIFAAFYRFVYVCYTGKENVSVPWSTNFRIMALLGLIGGLHTALSNFSLELNTVSLFTVSKSTSIIFILIFVILLGMEKFTWRIILIVGMIAFGLAMFTYKSLQFNLSGFIVALASSFMSGLRWTLAQYVFQKANLGIRNPVDLMFYVDLWVFVIILPLLLLIEGPDILSKLCTGDAIYQLISLALISTILAFFMETTKYLVIRRTSSLTVSVLGIVKEVATLVIAYFFLGDKMSPINFAGMVLCIGGVSCHATHKYSKAKKRHYLEVIGLNKEAKHSDESISDSDDSTCNKSASYLNLCHP